MSNKNRPGSADQSEADQMHRRFELHEAIRDVLLPHERIIWTQRGRGVRWPLVYTGLAVLHLGGAIFSLYLLIASAPGAPITTHGFLLAAGIAAIAVIAALHARVIFGPAYETYVLTDLRMIHGNLFLKPVVRSLVAASVTGEDEFPITYVMAWGTRESGWLTLRGDLAIQRPFRFHFHPPVVSLVGITQPVELATLVKSTLKLDFAIEDHTRP